ncbi:MAG: hypothetical protein JJU15_18270 [Pararhodobacter sp.]|nr:hypothetical protein [Pararhodobacter sp.]
MAPPTSPVLDALIARAAMADAPRIEAVDLEGQRYWIKRPEVLSLRWRLQKGNPARLFARERRIHRALMARGAPVPPILAEGEGYLVLPDSGPSLEATLTDAAPDERLRACRAAGAALAGLHALGLAHGRPHPRDLCWDGARIVFLDFERGSSANASERRQIWDLVLLIHGTYGLSPRETPEVAALCDGYRQGDQRGLWKAAQAWAKRWRWIDPLTRPLQRYEARHKPHRRYKELLAIPLTFKRLGA